MLEMKTYSNEMTVSRTATQKEVVNCINEKYGIPKKQINAFIHASRKRGYQNNNIIAGSDEIIIYLVKGKMFIGIIPLELSASYEYGMIYNP